MDEQERRYRWSVCIISNTRLGAEVDGLLNKQIAAELGTSEKSVKVHRSRVMLITGACTAAQLARLFVAVNTNNI
jgi:FixJ family two-component response regulator